MRTPLWGGVAGASLLSVATLLGWPLAGALVGAGLLVLAWLALGRHVAGWSQRRIAGVAVAWSAPLVFAPPLFSDDLHSYLAQGVIAARGLDPYEVGAGEALGAESPATQGVSPEWRDTPAPYGAAFLALCRAIARIAGENATATLALHRMLALGGVALIAWALPRLARRMGLDPGTALWLGLLNPLLLWHVIGGVHNDGLMVGLMLAGLELALGYGWRRLAAGVVLLNVAAGIKVVALAALGCLGAELIRTLRRSAVAGLVAGSAAVQVAIAAGTGLGFGWVGALRTPTDVYSWLAPTNQFGYVLGTLTGTVAASVAASIAIGAVIGVVVTGSLGWSTVRGARDPVRCLGLVFAALLVFGPVVQPWYLLWMVLPLAATVRTYRERRALAVISAVAAVLVPPVDAAPASIAWAYAIAGPVLAAVVLIVVLQSGTRTARIPTDRSARTPDDSGKRRLYSARRSAAGPSTYAS